MVYILGQLLVNYGRGGGESLQSLRNRHSYEKDSGTDCEGKKEIAIQEAYRYYVHSWACTDPEGYRGITRLAVLSP